MCGAAQFLSGGNPFVQGNPFISGAPNFVSGGMAEIAGWGNEIAGGDPVSALLGGSYDPGMMGFNPLAAIANLPNTLYHGLTKLNPFDSNFLLRSHPSHPANLQTQAINNQIAAHGAAVVDRHNTKARKTVSPLVATVVGGGLNANIPSNPQTLFLPETFVIPASIAPSFTVQDIKVGNVSQFPTTGDVPGEMFAQNAFNNGIRLDTVNPAINLSVAVTNITGGSLTFRGGFYGTLVQ
jgi:hypothetical protein